jgi:hypothetical protein
LVSLLQAFSFHAKAGPAANRLDGAVFGKQTGREITLGNVQDSGIAELAVRFETRHASND